MAFPYCVSCKGSRDLCGLGRCPLLERIRERIKPVGPLKDSVEGPSPPSVFVGRYGYPRITIGPLAAPVDIPLPERLESQEFLYGRSMEDVYSIRSSLVRGKYRVDARLSRDPRVFGSEPIAEVDRRLPVRGRKVLSSVQELALSERSLDTSMKIRELGGRSPEPPRVDEISMPMGPSINVDKVSLDQNPRVPNAVERAVGDTDLGASEASVSLYGSGTALQHLVRLFSVGMIGVERKRRLVPTRWSITAVDDILSKSVKERVSRMEPLEKFLLYKAERFGNHFLVALYPPPFRYEMLEQWQSGSLWGHSPVIHDHEGPRGRKDYASSITGAYYAARLSALEHLEDIRRNAGATVIRWITGDYWAPLGVWVIRETVKHALKGGPEVFDTMEALIERVDRLSGMRNWRSKTKYLTTTRISSLDDFL